MKNLHSRAKLIAFLANACLALAPVTLAVEPPPDGGYSGGNTAEGEDALFSLDTSQGLVNTAIGFQALFSNTAGDSNTASGYLALFSNTTGFSNTANGSQALFSNTTGNNNAATGSAALFLNSTGSQNTANGSQALFGNTTGFKNTGIGDGTLRSNTTGKGNTATGAVALYYNTIGNNNTASGDTALASNTTGRNNTAAGQNALRSNTTGSKNIAIGSNAGLKLTTGSNNIDIGNAGVIGESNTIRIGTTGIQTATFIAGVSGATVPTGVAVIVDANGQLGTTTSSARFKEAIKPMDKASEAILELKPVSFRYRKELDPAGIPQFGLVAEEVAKVNPDLVARDEQGKPYTVRYEAVNAMLLNEFLKEHRKAEEQTAINQRQEATIAQQQKNIEALTVALKAQGEQIRNVSDQLRAQATTPRVVAND